jgi:hypothetical protein
VAGSDAVHLYFFIGAVLVYTVSLVVIVRLDTSCLLPGHHQPVEECLPRLLIVLDLHLQSHASIDFLVFLFCISQKRKWMNFFTSCQRRQPPAPCPS